MQIFSPNFVPESPNPKYTPHPPPTTGPPPDRSPSTPRPPSGPPPRNGRRRTSSPRSRSSRRRPRSASTPRSTSSSATSPPPASPTKHTSAIIYIKANSLCVYLFHFGKRERTELDDDVLSVPLGLLMAECWLVSCLSVGRFDDEDDCRWKNYSARYVNLY